MKVKLVVETEARYKITLDKKEAKALLALCNVSCLQNNVEKTFSEHACENSSFDVTANDIETASDRLFHKLVSLID